MVQAFAHVVFDNTDHDNATFDSFEVNLPPDENEVAFKMNIKPICNMMKNLKKVKNMVLFTESGGVNGRNQIIFEMTNEASIKRTHKFDYQDTDIVNAYFDEQQASKLTVYPKVLNGLLEHLHQTSGEIAVEVSENAFRVKSFHQDLGLQVDTKGHAHNYMNTEMVLVTTEFEKFDYKSDESEQELVFCMKEMKALLSLCEQIEGMTPLNMCFCGTGSPIKFSCESLEFVVSLTMATLEKKHLQTIHASQFARENGTTGRYDDDDTRNHECDGSSSGVRMKRTRINEDD